MKTLSLFLVLFSPGIEAILKSRSAKPAIIEKPINVTYNAIKMHEALKISNEAMVIRVLCDKTYNQRRQIVEMYKKLYNEDLVKKMAGTLTGQFDMLTHALVEDRDMYLAKELHGMFSDGVMSYTIIEILTGLNRTEKDAILAAHLKYYQLNLEFVEGEERQDGFYFLTSYLLQGAREETSNSTEAKEDARKLYEAGEKRCLGTDKPVFLDILTKRSLPHLQMVFDEYLNLTGHQIEQAIESEFRGSLESGLLDIVRMARNTAAYYAFSIRRSMNFVGTYNEGLIRTMVTRADVDLHSIREEWDASYEDTLYDWIIDDTSGYYREALLAILDGNNYD